MQYFPDAKYVSCIDCHLRPDKEFNIRFMYQNTSCHKNQKSQFLCHVQYFQIAGSILSFFSCK